MNFKLYRYDIPALILIEASIAIIVMFSVYKDYDNNRKARRLGVSCEVVRGPTSMSALFTVYASAMASLLILVNEVSAIDGNKVPLIIFNFLFLTYEFFFNRWFRNSIFFRFYERIKKD